jgi:hypothetical protein
MQPRPVKRRPGIGFAPRRNVAVACDPVNTNVWPGRHNLLANSGQRLVLILGIRHLVTAFKLNANGEIVALVLAAKTGTTSVPGTVQQADKLDKRTITAYQQVG